MSSWWIHLGGWGATIEQQSAEMAEPMAPGAMSMIVGVYAGLVIGTLGGEHAGVMRRQIEAELAAGMGVAPESLEAQMRQTLAVLEARGR